MANHKSALKRARQSEKRNLRNRSRKSVIKTSLRTLDEAISAGNKEQAESLFRAAQTLIAKASSKGTLHARTASRKIGRLARRVASVG